MKSLFAAYTIFLQLKLSPLFIHSSNLVYSTETSNGRLQSDQYIESQMESIGRGFFFFVLLEDGVKCWQPLDYLRKTEPKIIKRYMKANKENFPGY